MIYLQDIPKNYAYCFAGKGICPKADTCLRAIAAQVLTDSPEDTPKRIDSINPVYVQRLPDLNTCPCYRDNTPVRYARGMTKLFEDLPLKQARLIRLRVMNCFSCESYFYQSRKGIRLISLKEQQAIQRVFLSAGITGGPKFDEYQYSLAWIE